MPGIIRTKNERIEMNFKVLKWQISRGSLARRLLLKAFLFGLAMVTISFIQVALNVRMIRPLALSFDECPLSVRSIVHLNFTWSSKLASALSFSIFRASTWNSCKKSEDLTITVFKELMGKNLLDYVAKALCVGEGTASSVLALRELGFSNAFGVDRHPFFSLLRKHIMYKLDFEDNSFDFVFSRALDRVSIPALHMREIERVLRPGGTGAVLVNASNSYSSSLIRSAIPVSSFLRISNVVHVCSIGSFTLVIFKKRLNNVASFEHYRLPNECPSVAGSKPFMKFIEPFVNEHSGLLDTEPSYLPKFMNISSRNRLIYINVGAGESLNSSIVKMLKPNYSILPQAFHVYIMDHNTSVISSHVKKPGITFVYHPGLAGDEAAPKFHTDEYFTAPLDEEKFDFIRWFKDAIAEGDFVVLLMNARSVELKILFELFETGAICRVDELFLRCSDGVDCNTAVCGDCMSLFSGLRNSGVFVHRLWGD